MPIQIVWHGKFGVKIGENNDKFGVTFALCFEKSMVGIPKSNFHNNVINKKKSHFTYRVFVI